MRLMFFVALGAVALFSLPFFMARGDGVSVAWETRSEGKLSGADNSKEVSFYLPTEANSNRVRLELRSVGGQMFWTLADPQGEIVWEGRVAADDRMKEMRKLPIVPGRWVMSVRAEGGGGEFRFRRWIR